MKPFLLLASIAVCALGAAADHTPTFAMIDVNGDGFVSESEFIGWKTSDGTTPAAEALVKFIEIDADASGMISEAELMAAMDAKETDDNHSTDSM